MSSLDLVGEQSRRIMVWLFAMAVGSLLLIGLSGQAFAQAPRPMPAPEWTSLVDPVYNSTPANHATSKYESPLADLHQADPSGLLTQSLPAEFVAGNTSYSSRQNRSTATLVIGWNQPEFRHRRLYFEDPQIERGNAQRQFPNVAAGSNFVKSLIVFPIRLITGQ